MLKKTSKINGFTIIELLVVIVVIGILATITIVSYSNVQQRAWTTSLISDLTNASTQLEMDKIINNQYPATKELANNGTGIRYSQYIDLSYTYNSALDSFCLTAKKDSLSYYITSTNKIPAIGECPFSSIAWGNSIGYEYGEAVAQTSDDGYVVVGYSNSFGNGQEAFIVKYSSTGVPSWSKTWGGTGNDNFKSIIQTSDGNFVVLGQSSSYGAGLVDVVLVKYSQNGEVIWNKTWGGANNDYSASILESNDNNYIVAGSTTSYGSGGDMFIAKFNAADGALSWSKTWGGTGADEAVSLIQDNSNNYLLTGFTNGFSVVGYDAIFIKLSSDGTFLWSRTWGGSGTEIAMSTIQASDNSYIATGYTNSFGSVGNDVFIVSIDTNGNFGWNKKWGGSGADTGLTAINTDDGNFIVYGRTGSLGAGNIDTFYFKFEINGTPIWGKTWGGGGYENANEIIKTDNGNFVATGYQSSWSSGDYDIYLIKFDSDGVMAGCSSPMCQSHTISTTVSSATTGSPSATSASQTITSHTPSAIITNPTYTTTPVLIP